MVDNQQIELIVKLRNDNPTSTLPKTLKIKLKTTSTIRNLKQTIIMATQGKFVPATIIIKSRNQPNHITIESLKLCNGDVVMTSQLSDVNKIITITLHINVGRNRGKVFHIMINKDDLVSDLNWRMWRDYEIQPSKCDLW